MFSELPGSVFRCLSLVLGNSQSLLLQICLLLLFFFLLFLLLVFLLCIYSHCAHFLDIPQFLDIRFWLFILFSLWISILEVSVDISSSSLILSLVIPSLLKSPPKMLFISITVCLISRISLWFFLRVSISLFTLPVVYFLPNVYDIGTYIKSTSWYIFILFIE